MKISEFYLQQNKLIGNYILSYLQQNRCILPFTHSEEIKSSVFLKFLKMLKTKTIEKPEAYLFRVTESFCISHFRKPPCTKSQAQIKIISIDEVTEENCLVSSRCTDQQRIELDELLEILRQEIPLLEPKYNRAIMDFLEDFKHKEIAEKQQLSIETSRKNRQLAIHFLRQALLKRGIVTNDLKKNGGNL